MTLAVMWYLLIFLWPLHVTLQTTDNFLFCFDGYKLEKALGTKPYGIFVSYPALTVC